MDNSEIDKWLDRYPNMVYVEDGNTFHYQEIILEPFVCGIFVKTGKLSYGLRSKEYPWIWLFEGKDPIDSWMYFIKNIVEQKQRYQKDKKCKPFWKKFLGL